MEETTTRRKELQDNLMSLTERIQTKSMQQIALTVGIGAIYQSYNDLDKIPWLVQLSEQIAKEVDFDYEESTKIQYQLMNLDK